MTTIPPALEAEFVAVLAAQEVAGRCLLAIDCDPSGRPVSGRVLAPGYSGRPHLFPPARPLPGLSCLVAAMRELQRRPRPGAGVMGDSRGRETCRVGR